MKTVEKIPAILRNTPKEITEELLGDYGVNPDVLRGNYGERGLLVLLAFINNPYVTKQKLAEGFGVSLRTIGRDIDKLKEAGLVARKGSDKKGIWSVIKQATE